MRSGYPLAAVVIAAPVGEYAEAARRLLQQIAERQDWLAAVNRGTASAYQTFLQRHPTGTRAAEAHFRIGYAFYRLGDLNTATVWQADPPPQATDDERARLALWLGKVAAAQGQVECARQVWQQSSAMQAVGYYALRARQILAASLAGRANQTICQRTPAWIGQPRQDGSLRGRRGLVLSTSRRQVPFVLPSSPRSA